LARVKSVSEREETELCKQVETPCPDELAAHTRVDIRNMLVDHS